VEGAFAGDVAVEIQVWLLRRDWRR
jgi:hypothetical protein